MLGNVIVLLVSADSVLVFVAEGCGLEPDPVDLSEFELPPVRGAFVNCLPLISYRIQQGLSK